MDSKIVIVGAGLTGCVIAERIANEWGRPVSIIEKRSHIGGNCWSYTDKATGIEVHGYGPHIFHTSNSKVWNYISRFTEWNNYRHHVWTRYDNKTYPMPINLATINSYYNKDFSPQEAREFLAAEIRKENISNPLNLEEKAISLIGRPLYEAFIRGYTIKQWEKDPRELSPDIITRLPVRYNFNARYFNDLWEGIPLNGYTAIFERMLENPLIDVRLNTDWNPRSAPEEDCLVIYTGPIDRFFDYRFGRLEWRTLDFTSHYHDLEEYQGAAQVNEANVNNKLTRKTEYRHFHPELDYNKGTIVVDEASRFATPDDEPYYPVNTPPNIALYKKYRDEAKKVKNVIFGGRLGNYRYYDMDDTIENALKTFDQLPQ